MISGFTCIRNNFELDYCVELTIQSMLPISDEVVVCDSDSTDGTREMLDKWAEREPKLRIINRPWEEPNGKLSWWVDWIFWAQQHLRYPKMLFLDGDEVLDPMGYNTLLNAGPKDCYWARRLNYWHDVWHEAPHGTVCAHEVARFGPTELRMWSDEIHDGVQFPFPEPEIRVKAKRSPHLVVHHYGFLRKREAMFRKVRNNLKYFFGCGQDVRILEAEKHPEIHWTEFCKFLEPLLKTNGYQPAHCWPWLKERGAMG
jgi:glycosyltransferase involved in cell wall biosynthesis